MKIKLVLDVLLRIFGVMLGLGGVLGSVWFMETVTVTSFAIPLCLLALSITPTKVVGRYWWLLLIGLGVCIVDLVFRGAPFLRSYQELDVEVMAAMQLALLIYFSVQAATSACSKFCFHISNVIP